jgi:hypothetical protein
MGQSAYLLPPVPQAWPPPGLAAGSRIATIRSEQVSSGLEPCYLTQKRLLCAEHGCRWRTECRRLVAAWKR